MPLVPTIIRCCAHIVRLVCGQKDRWTATDGTVTLAVQLTNLSIIITGDVLL